MSGFFLFVVFSDTHVSTLADKLYFFFLLLSWNAVAIGSEWDGDVLVRLGHITSDQQTIQVNFQMPDKSR